MTARAGRFSTAPGLPFETRRQARDEKREAVSQTAVELFLEQGYHHAMLAGVAARLNISKPALYNDFGSKDEILFACWMKGHGRVVALLSKIDADGGSGFVKLGRLMRAYGEMVATDHGATLVRFDDHELSGDHATAVRDARRSIDRAFRSYLQEGIDDGPIKPCDVKLTGFAFVGALNWIGHWFRPAGALSLAAVANEITTRLLAGVAA